MISSLLQAFLAQVSSRPDAAALHYPESMDPEVMDYRTLDTRSDRLASHLAGAGVRAGDTVGIFFAPEPTLIVSVLAAHKLGARYLMLDAELPAPRLDAIIADCPMAAVLGVPPPEVTLGPDTAQFGFEAARDISGGRGERRYPVPEAADAEELYVCYTSGSSGTPKGIVARTSSVFNLVSAEARLDIGPEDGVGQLSNPAFDAFTWEVWGCLVNGGRLVGADRRLAADTGRFGTFVRARHVTVAFMTTAVFNLHAATSPTALARLRLLVFGGEKADLAAVRIVRSAMPGRLVHAYGPTETTTFATCHVVGEIAADATSLPIGSPLAGYEATVWHAEGRPAAPGEPGELYIGGAGVAGGYLNRPELTTERFGPSPADPTGPVTYRTGDLVTTDESGLIHFLGRRDNQVKVRGQRVELEDVETHLRALPAVREAVVCPVRDRDSVSLVAVVEPAQRHGAVSTWNGLYDELYRGIDLRREDHRYRGWNASATHQPIPADEMRHWLTATLARIRRLRPRRILEIGVGSGLLLNALAPSADTYWATDFSHSVLDKLAEQCATDPELARVELRHREAIDLSGLPENTFDTVILNSVIQYFPSVDYLSQVLKGLLDLLTPGGRLFVGDVRNQRLAGRFYTEVAEHSAGGPHAHTAAQLAEAETELLVDPDYFALLPQVFDRIDAVDLLVKRGRHRNELTDYRYDVLLGTGETGPPRSDTALEWTWDGGNTAGAALADRLAGVAARPVVVTGVPNARHLPAHSGAVEPEDLYDIGAAAGRPALVSWGAAPDELTAWFLPAGADDAVSGTARPHAGRPETWPTAYANTPTGQRAPHSFAEDVVRRLRTELPAYMIPSRVVVEDRLPRNANGKLDRHAAADLAERYTPAPKPAESPATFREAAVRSAVAAALGVDQDTIAPGDDFFDLGGHSIAAVRLAHWLSGRLGVDVSTGDIYEARTVRQIAARVFPERPDPPEARPTRRGEGESGAEPGQEARPAPVPEGRSAPGAPGDVPAAVDAVLTDAEDVALSRLAAAADVTRHDLTTAALVASLTRLTGAGAVVMLRPNRRLAPRDVLSWRTSRGVAAWVVTPDPGHGLRPLSFALVRSESRSLTEEPALSDPAHKRDIPADLPVLLYGPAPLLPQPGRELPYGTGLLVMASHTGHGASARLWHDGRPACSGLTTERLATDWNAWIRAGLRDPERPATASESFLPEVREVMVGQRLVMRTETLAPLLPSGMRPAAGDAVPVYVLDEANQPVPEGRYGRLHVPMASLDTTGPVAQDAQRAADRLIADPLRAGAVMVRTASTARWHRGAGAELLAPRAAAEAEAAGESDLHQPPAGPDVFDDELEMFTVLVNRTGERSLWPMSIAVPAGWAAHIAPTSRTAALKQLTPGRDPAPGESDRRMESTDE
ncbi:amino acid adenylation domain-containing protein [Streptomyces sp. NPDC002514]|uniref:amino acid adenylation domain-containing protein n=1 Tax=Streptomyces sp. NPDC001270 TaxID=3364554 RepID=UPI0036A118AD